MLLVSYRKSHLQTQDRLDFLQCHLRGVEWFCALHLGLRYIVEVIFVKRVRSVCRFFFFFFFCICMPSCSRPVVEKITLSPMKGLTPLSKGTCLDLCESISGLSFMAHWYNCLFLCPNHTAFVSAVMESSEGTPASRILRHDCATSQLRACAPDECWEDPPAGSPAVERGIIPDERRL